LRPQGTQCGGEKGDRELSFLFGKRLYGFSSTAPLQFKHVPSAQFSSLFYVEDEELDFDAIMNAPLPKLPADICYTGSFIAHD